MNKEQLQKRKEKAENQPMMIVNTGDGYRVHSARNPSQFYHVNLEHEHPVCNCPDFEKHKNDPLAQCKHILAVSDYVEKSKKADAKVDEYEDLERAAIQAEGNQELGEAGLVDIAFLGPEAKPETKPSHMLIRRSISPDGHIDSVSVELDFALFDEPAEEIKKKAAETLKLQTEIIKDFLGSIEKPPKPVEVPKIQPAPRPIVQQPKPVLATMLDIGVMEGKWGPRYFINVDVEGKVAKLFGSPKQLAEHIALAGYSVSQSEIADGVRLNIPCRVVAKPNHDGRYLNIERVFPER